MDYIRTLTVSATISLSIGCLNASPREHFRANKNFSDVNAQLICEALHQYASEKGLVFTNGLKSVGDSNLSWRVHLLPALGEAPLYKQFHLDEPWDSPHNRKLLGQMPTCFESGSFPNEGLVREGYTVFLSVQHADYLVVEGDNQHATPWTKPEKPLQLNNDPTLLGRHDGAFLSITKSLKVKFVDK